MKHYYGLLTGTLLVTILLITQILGIQPPFLSDTKVYAAGNTYYVAKNGSDNNPGTEAQPWLTIRKAANTLVAGDIVYVKSGTYNEQVSPANSGNSSAWINYKVYPGNTVTIDGSGTSGNSSTGIFNIIGKSYIEVNGFTITKAPGNGVALYGECHYINLRNLTINTAQVSGIHATYNWSSSTGYITNILIDGCNISNVCIGGDQEGISLIAVSNFEIKNTKVHDMPYPAGSFSLGKEGIDTKVGCSNGSIHDNEVYNTKQGLYIDASSTTSNITVYNNRFHHNRDSGLYLWAEGSGGAATGLNYYNNIIYSNNRGFVVENSTKSKQFTFINNTLYHNADCEIRIAAPGSSLYNCIFRNNIINGTSDMLFQYADPSGIIVDHNLFYASSYNTSTYGTSYIQGKDPQFFNASSGNFNLQSTSPARDSGYSSGAPSIDIAGTFRPQGNGYDIGAYEYAGITPTPTPILPSINTNSATGVNSNQAVLNGNLSSLGSSTSVNVSFEYGLTTNYGNTTISQAKTSTGDFNATITGLNSNTTYHFRAKCIGNSTVYGNDVVFITSESIPVPGTAYFGLNSGNQTWAQSANILDVMRFQNTAGTGTLTKLELLFDSSLTSGNVKFGIYADNNGKPGNLLLSAGESTINNGWVTIGSLNFPVTYNAYYWLSFIMSSGNGVRYQTGQATNSHYYLTSNYGTLPDVYPTNSISTNSSPYVMRATVAVSSTPVPVLPSVTTNEAGNITTSGAVLNGLLTDVGSDSSVTVSFDFGLTTNYGSTITGTPSTFSSPGTFSANITGLNSNTLYHYRAKATGDGTNYGADQTFTTNSAIASITLSNLNQTYDGYSKSVTYSTNPVGLTASITYNGSNAAPINANSYSVVATITSPGYVGSTTGTLKIAKATPSFSNLSSPTVSQGTASTSLGGNIRLGSLIPTGNISITLNGVTQTAIIDASGNFSSSFATVSLASASYPITYSYAGSTNFNSLIDNNQALNVNSINQPPILNSIGNKTIKRWSTLNITISAVDPNRDSLTYSISGLPEGATFNNSTRTFSWTPTVRGKYYVTFTVSDGSLSDSETILITVR